jgi:hypothetical protein
VLSCPVSQNSHYHTFVQCSQLDIHLLILAMVFVLILFLLLPWLSSLIVVYVATNIRRDNHLKKFKNLEMVSAVNHILRTSKQGSGAIQSG